MSRETGWMLRVTVWATVAQLAMVVIGHVVTAVANLFGPLGITISLVAGLVWARRAGSGIGGAIGGGALVGGACALIGIAVSWALGDVTALLLAVGTLSSAVAGAIGGSIGRLVARRAGGVAH